MSAVYENNIEEASKLIKDDKFDVNQENDLNRTALYMAASLGHLPMTKLLIENGANVNHRSNYHGTPLHEAAEAGHQSIVKFLVQNKANINAQDDLGRTPLGNAIRGKHSIIIEFLLDNGADIHLRDARGDTHLHIALICKEYKAAKLLIEKNIDINYGNVFDTTALHIVASQGNIELVKLLVEKGADIYKKDQDGKTAFHEAVLEVNFEIAKFFLVDTKFDINIKDNNECTALIMATNISLDISFFMYTLTQNFSILGWSEPQLIKQKFNQKCKIIEFLLDNGACVSDTILDSLAAQDGSLDCKLFNIMIKIVNGENKHTSQTKSIKYLFSNYPSKADLESKFEKYWQKSTGTQLTSCKKSKLILPNEELEEYKKELEAKDNTASEIIESSITIHPEALPGFDLKGTANQPDILPSYYDIDGSANQGILGESACSFWNLQYS